MSLLFSSSSSHRGGYSFFLFLSLITTLFLSSPMRVVSALHYSIPAGEVFTVEEYVYTGHMLTFQFQFAEGSSPLDVVVLVDGEEEKAWQNSKSGLTTITFPAAHSHVESEVEKLVVTVKIDNSVSHFSSVPVNFYFRTAIDFAHVGSEELLDPLESKVRALGMSLQRLDALQVSLKIEQKNHRNTVETINRRVLMWSVCQVIALFAVTSVNFLFFKRFMEKKSSF